MSAPALTAFVNGLASVTADNLNTFEQTCDIYEQLRGLIGLSGMQVFCRGATAINDGGQGEFYWDASSTAPDNGTTILKPTGGATAGRWIAIAPAGVSGFAPINSPIFTGNPQAPTPGLSNNSTSLATTAFVNSLLASDLANYALLSQLANYAPLLSPALTGTPTGPTAAVNTNTTQLATTAFVIAQIGGSPGGAVTVVGYSYANPGYVKLTNGTINFAIQFGSVTAPANSNITVPLPQAAASFAYPVCSGGGAGSGGSSSNFPAIVSGSVSTTQFTIGNNSNTNWQTFWLAFTDF